MPNSKKLLQAAAGAAGGAGLDVDEVFSTYLYEGNGSTGQTITNGIDLSGEGGMVWIKERDATSIPVIYDTERGVGKLLRTNGTNAETDLSASSLGITSYNSNGFSLGDTTNNENDNGINHASWTFRKAPKFFDVVTYTGNGTNNRAIGHNLGTDVGMVLFKRTDSSGNWIVWHRSNTFAPTEGLALNQTSGTSSTYGIGNGTTEPTATNFYVSTNLAVENLNATGGTYVAYLFAHNDGDGDFGPDADQDIVKCGSYTGNGSSTGPTVNLGFEPQWFMVKNVSSSNTNWFIFDNMRGLPMGTGDKYLRPNLNNAEGSVSYIDLLPNGLALTNDGIQINQNNNTYIYMAIRRGPLAEPTSATDVFEANSPAGSGSTSFKSGNTSGSLFTDFFIGKPRITVAGINWIAGSRLTSKLHYPNLTLAEETTTFFEFDTQSGFNWNSDWVTTADSEYLTYHWKRAPSYFDVVAYTGNGTAGKTVNHNLGVEPEMIWVKNRSTGYSENWNCYFKTLGNTYVIFLNKDFQAFANSNYWNSTTPTATQFTLGDYNGTNRANLNYIAYLFASLAGVSKVFSVTKSSGSDASVDCGFSSGPRFVLLKRTDSSGDWYVWDSERGIVAGNDPYVLLNSNAAEVTSTDYIDPTSNGFSIVNGGLADGDYIGYAIA